MVVGGSGWWWVAKGLLQLGIGNVRVAVHHQGFACTVGCWMHAGLACMKNCPSGDGHGGGGWWVVAAMDGGDKGSMAVVPRGGGGGDGGGGGVDTTWGQGFDTTKG